MTTLAGIWDGERHLLEPDEHFHSEGATMVIDDFEEQEEEDVLSPFESASVEPKLRDTGVVADPRFPNRPTEQAWGTLSVVLTAFANIVGISKDQYQENMHYAKTTETVWSFTAKESLGERI